MKHYRMQDLTVRELQEYLKTNQTVILPYALCEQHGIIPKAAIAQKAIPYCNITFVTGNEMETGLSGYLKVLWEANPKSIGGKMPGADFYYGTTAE